MDTSRSRNRNANIAQWSLDIIDTAQANFALVINDTPLMYQEAIGSIDRWAPKDELAHLAYWIDVFETNIRAFRHNEPFISTQNYLAMNDAAWTHRKDWSWEYTVQEISRTLRATRIQIGQLEGADLVDATRCTVEPDNAQPRSLIRSLLYELIDHPIHHFVGLYKTFASPSQALALLANTSALVTRSGVSKWAAPSRRKIQAHENSLKVIVN